MKKSFFLALLLFSLGVGKDFIPHLDTQEHQFRQHTSYPIEDFHLQWDISYLRVFSFIKIYREKQKLLYGSLHTLLKSDDRILTVKERKGVVYLANLMKEREAYPIKEGYGPWGYRYFLVVYIDQKGKIFALENMKELKEMLGKIDTVAKLHLWLRLKYHEYPYSYLDLKKNWRVRYNGWDTGECYYLEYFKFYTKNGDFLKKKDLTEYHKKGCVEILE